VGEAESLAFGDQQPATFRFGVSDTNYRVTTSGTGELYLVLQTQGLPAGEETPAYDRNLKVRRRWTDGSGEDLDPMKLRVGDLVHVAAPAMSCAGVPCCWKRDTQR